MAVLPASAISVFHFDTDLNDALGNATVTNGGATLSTTQKKIGAKSLYFDGTTSTGNYLDILLNLSTTYTIGFWVYSMSTPTAGWFPALFSTRKSGDGFDPGEYVYPCFGTSDFTLCGVEWNQGVGSAMSRNAWHHIAFTRSGSTRKCYLDGVLNVTLTSGTTPTALNNLCIGCLITSNDSINGNSYFKGYIDEVLVTNDVLWTANFTPPTDAYVTHNRRKFFIGQLNNQLFGGV